MRPNPVACGRLPRRRRSCRKSCVLPRRKGPQRIGARKHFVVVPESVWREHASPPRMPMGRWLIENMPRGTNLEIPDRGSTRKVPFIDEDDE